MYYFPANGGYLPAAYKQDENHSGSFLGNYLSYYNIMDEPYHLIVHGFSEYGLWGEEYINTASPHPPIEKFTLIQPLDNTGFGISPHFVDPDYMELYRFRP